MVKPAIVRKAVLGLDVGKSSHWACLVTAEGEIAANRPVMNSEKELDDLFAQVGRGTLVVVDQVRNIGALAIRRARMAGLEVAYLPGIAAHGAARLFAGDAKTDERDAMVIAKTALGIPDSLLPVPRGNAELEAARSMAAQRNHMVTCATRTRTGCGASCSNRARPSRRSPTSRTRIGSTCSRSSAARGGSQTRERPPWAPRPGARTGGR